MRSADDSQPEITFIVIGYNEGENLRACLESVRSARLGGVSYELIYVDGGSEDDSIAVARSVGGVRVLGGEKRRRAAENRNLGAREARGRYLQFLDGDMALDPEWPATAKTFLEAHPEVAVVAGRLVEANPSYLYQVVQLDWQAVEGEVPCVGGAAMYRREVFEAAGGFPEDVRYGEEPLLHWRIRNEHGGKIWYLDRPMAKHDLGFRHMVDYWRHCVRNGRSYMEIASIVWYTKDPMWRREVVRNFAWTGGYIVIALLFVTGTWMLRMVILGLMVAVLLRMAMKSVMKGHSLPIAIGYAIHVYAAKVPLAYGQLRGRQDQLSD
jgi:glycosyltransferase involved in cell wall biosynthesis